MLLERFGPQNAALAGDLVEAYQLGRSASWYWRQTVAIVARHFVADARMHWVVAVRAIAVGMVAFRLLGIVTGPIFAHLWMMKLALRTGIPGDLYVQLQLDFLADTTLWVCGCIGVGWIVGRTHRRHLTVAIVGFATVMMGSMLLDDRLYFLVRNTLTHERFFPYLVKHLLSDVVTIAGLVVGGMMGGANHGSSLKVAE
jgi:hypothetical protein